MCWFTWSQHILLIMLLRLFYGIVYPAPLFLDELEIFQQRVGKFGSPPPPSLNILLVRQHHGIIITSGIITSDSTDFPYDYVVCHEVVLVH